MDSIIIILALWDVLAETKAKIFYQGGKDGKVLYEKWSKSVGRTEDYISEQFFIEGYSELKTFLNLD